MEVAIAVSISVPTSSMKGYSSCRWTITLAPVEATRKGLYSSSFMYKMTCSPGRIRQLVVAKAGRARPGSLPLCLGSLTTRPRHFRQVEGGQGSSGSYARGGGLCLKAGAQNSAALQGTAPLPRHALPVVPPMGSSAEHGAAGPGESWAPAEGLAAGLAVYSAPAAGGTFLLKPEISLLGLVWLRV